MGNILVCGSIAYDHIMEFPGLFHEQILPDKIHSLNVSFLVSNLKKVRGGTAPNISYNLAMVGEKPIVLGTAGRDFYEYKEWLCEKKVDTRYIKVLEDDYTASCFIMTDKNNNQITEFYPGAMSQDAEISLTKIDMKDISLVVIAPTEPTAMIKWTNECKLLGVPYLYDPGMQIPRLTGEELTESIKGAQIVVFNEYEYNMMFEKTGMSRDELLDNVGLVVETLGDGGSILRTKDQRVHIKAAKADRVIDPTGAGDAYRAGLIKAYLMGESLEVIGRYASISAVYAVEHKGATQHEYSMEQFEERYNKNYGGVEL